MTQDYLDPYSMNLPQARTAKPTMVENHILRLEEKPYAMIIQSPMEKTLDLSDDAFSAARSVVGELPLFAVLCVVNDESNVTTNYLIAANKPALAFMLKTIRKDRAFLSDYDWCCFESYLFSKRLVSLDKADRRSFRFELPLIIDFAKD